MNITGEQARLIAQTDAMVQQEQGRKWAEPQVEAPDMVSQPEPEPLLAAGVRVWLGLGGHGVSVVPR